MLSAWASKRQIKRSQTMRFFQSLFGGDYSQRVAESLIAVAMKIDDDNEFYESARAATIKLGPKAIEHLKGLMETTPLQPPNTNDRFPGFLDWMNACHSAGI